ncbi:MAG: GNAT family N-acetyltransferase [Rhodoglobus sp.]
MTTEVQQDTNMNRFELLLDGASVGESDYRIQDNSIVITHTEIDPSQRGKGLAGELVRGALNLIRADTDYRVVPSCPFTADWIAKHPEYEDLLSR